MTDTNTPSALEEVEALMPDELTLLKERAKKVGMSFSPNIGLEVLKAKLETFMAQNQVNTAQTTTPTDAIDWRKNLVAEQTKLVRIRVACLNPAKSDLPGEIITVANDYIGTIRKFVPFGDATNDGYHVPFAIYSDLAQRKYLSIRTIKDIRTGRSRIESSWVKEFNIEILPALTREELDKLATAQIAAGVLAETE